MKELLDLLLDGEVLTEHQAEALLHHLTDADLDPVPKAAALAALRTRGENGDEIRGMAMAMRRQAIQVQMPDGGPLVDTCGTGGDGHHSFNVSTAAALLLAATGVRVVKHGNRSVSSKCGSADLVEALDVPLATGADMARAQLVDTNFAFLYAPAFHPATAAVGPVRRAMGVRTAFNLLGPLTNPAWPRYQLIGAYSTEAAHTIAEALQGMPITRCFVVHGAEGFDEATPCGTFIRLEVTPGTIHEREIDPLFTYGVKRCTPDDLGGGDAEHNVRLLHEVFSGARGPLRDAVLINAALVMELVGLEEQPKRAFERAADVLDSGRATWFLGRLRNVPA